MSAPAAQSADVLRPGPSAIVAEGPAPSPAGPRRDRPSTPDEAGRAGAEGAPPRGPSRRLFALDVLRGLAIWLVMIHHVPANPARSVPYLKESIGLVIQVGWIGVDLFFVLSGYLISGLLFHELERDGRIKLSRFWLRRGLKIWPSYFAIYGSAVALWCSRSWWLGDFERLYRTLGNATYNVFFVQNYWPETRWPHSWSLAVEEHFYILLPLLLVALASRARPGGDGGVPSRLRGLVGIGVGLAVVVLGLRVLAASRGASPGQLYYPSHHRIDSLMCGVLLRYVSSYRPPWARWVARAWPLWLSALPICLVAAVLFPVDRHWAMGTFGFTLLYIASGGLVFLAGRNPDFGLDGPRPFRWLCGFLALSGVYSYTIYLAHAVVGSLYFYGLFRWSAAASGLSFLLLSVAAGVLASHAVERPFLRLRERWIPARGRTAPSIG